MADAQVVLDEATQARLRQEADDIFTSIDSYHAGSIGYRQLLSWVKSKAKESGIKKIPDEMLTATNEMFQKYDVENNGCLNADQFYALLKGMEEDAMFKELVASKEKKAAEEAARKAAEEEAAKIAAEEAALVAAAEAEAARAAEEAAAALAAAKSEEERLAAEKAAAEAEAERQMVLAAMAEAAAAEEARRQQLEQEAAARAAAAAAAEEATSPALTAGEVMEVLDAKRPGKEDFVADIREHAMDFAEYCVRSMNIPEMGGEMEKGGWYSLKPLRVSQFILADDDISVNVRILSNKGMNRKVLADVKVIATGAAATMEEIAFAFDKKTFPKLLEEDGALSAGTDDSPMRVQIAISFDLAAEMARGKTDYSRPLQAKNAKATIEVAEIPFVVTKGKHPKVYKAVLKFMTKDCINTVNGKIGEAVEGAISIIQEKLNLVTFNIGQAAKERAGVTWGISAEELQKIKMTFDKYDADGSGELDFSEVRSFCSELGLEFTDEELMEALDDMEAISGDKKNGAIDFDEFVSWWTSEQKAKAAGSVSARLAEGRDKIFKQEMAANSPMGRLLLARAAGGK